MRNSFNILIIPLVIASGLLLFSLGFGTWAFVSMQDYKNNSDQKAEAAAAVAAERAKTEKDNEFVQKEKEPLKNYTSPSQYGSVRMKYPKTWSAYADEQGENLTLYMQPDVVSSNRETPYSLKVEVLNQKYEQAIGGKDNDIKQGKLRASAFSLARVPDVLGLRFDGQITQQKSGSSIYLPLRDKTVVISSETPEKVPDLNNIILPNFEFSP